jgi:hypothetical protein
VVSASLRILRTMILSSVFFLTNSVIDSLPPLPKPTTVSPLWT